MTGKGHTATGVAFCVYPALVTYLSSGLLASVVAALMCIIGGTAPDWMEIQTKVKHKGKTVGVKRLIPHRTITHVISWWALLCAYSYYSLNGITLPISQIDPIQSVILSAALFGFTCGGLIHLLGDIPNKQRIPIFTPWDGIALNLWKSGEHERKIIVMVALSGVALSLKELFVL